MKRILFIFFLLQGLFSFSQTESNKIDEKGRKQGLWRKYDQYSYLIYQGYFKDDIPQGTFRYYYQGKDTALKALMTFRKNGKESFAILYHPNRKLMGTGKYVDQLKDSTWNYYDEEGRLISTDSYIKDKKHGLSKTYYPNGKVFAEINFKDGKKEGTWKEYFEDSKPKAEGFYTKDQMDGKTTYWYPNGKVAAQGLYRSGVRHMTWNYYKSDGTPESKEVYNMGKQLQGKAAEEFLKNQADAAKNTGKPDTKKTGTKTTGTKSEKKPGGGSAKKTGSTEKKS